MTSSRIRPSDDNGRCPPASPLFICLAFLFVLTANSAGLTQQEPQEEQEPTPGTGQADQQAMPMEGQSSQMQDMARAMESMADMCRLMMQREMQHRPYFLAAGGVVAALLAVALVLLIALEIQGIRFLGVRIKTERQKLP